MAETTQQIWTKEWPQEPGFYWLYGYASEFEKNRMFDKELYIVSARRGGIGMFYVCRGSFIYKREAEGVFTPAVVPEIPEEVPSATCD